MANNLVFNPVASQLATQIYGANGSSVLPVQVDSSGNLIVTGTITADIGTVTAIITSGTVTAITTLTFTATSTTVAIPAGTTVTALTEDTSQVKTVSFYVQNTSAVQAMAILQESPTTPEGFYVNDVASAATVTGTSQAIFVPAKFMQFTRILVGSTTDTVTANIYYNAQT